MNIRIVSIFLVGLLTLSGCATARDHRNLVESNSADKLTVGKVQREISIGMPSSEVIEVLGAPNIVSTDEERREVWVYDKISTDIAYSKNEGFATLILIGGESFSGAVSRNQRTLTIIIKFDKAGKVRDFAYHSTTF